MSTTRRPTPVRHRSVVEVARSRPFTVTLGDPSLSWEACRTFSTVLAAALFLVILGVF